MSSIWILEYRHRDRKNGKWSEWQSTELETRIAITAYRRCPVAVEGQMYERRAVEYVAKAEGK